MNMPLVKSNVSTGTMMAGWNVSKLALAVVINPALLLTVITTLNSALEAKFGNVTAQLVLVPLNCRLTDWSAPFTITLIPLVGLVGSGAPPDEAEVTVKVKLVLV